MTPPPEKTEKTTTWFGDLMTAIKLGVLVLVFLVAAGFAAYNGKRGVAVTACVLAVVVTVLAYKKTNASMKLWPANLLAMMRGTERRGRRQEYIISNNLAKSRITDDALDAPLKARGRKLKACSNGT